MWTTIYVSIDFRIIKQVEKALKSEGFLVKLNKAVEDDSDSLYEISVLENEAMDAQDFLMETGVI